MAKNAYLARQPIVDTKQELLGYELLFRTGKTVKSARIADEHDAGIQVIANALFDMGTHWLLAGKLAFINMGGAGLMDDTATLLPPDKVVVELTESVLPTPEVMAQIAELKRGGLKFSLDDYTPGGERDALLSQVAYVKIDVLGLSPEALRASIAKARAYPVKLVAKRVEKKADFKQCQALGFDFFQGYFFARPENLIARVINPAQAIVLELLDKVRAGADLAEIEKLFKRDAALTYKLLRYINSAGFGLSCEVQSIRHAVSILGMQPLYRWLTLLLATAGSHASSPALMRNAIARGRLCELLGAHIMDRSERDNLFITGVFSMLDALLDTTMDSILERLVIPETIGDALLSRAGMYGPILALAEACELNAEADIGPLADALMLTPEQVNQAHLDALAWVEQLGLE
jgi:EAL and modified HD-GYP domain-containing signal transduction protein